VCRSHLLGGEADDEHVFVHTGAITPDEQPLEGLVGILTDEQAARLRDHSRSFRDEVEERAGGEC